MIIKRVYCCVGRKENIELIQKTFKKISGNGKNTKECGTQLFLSFFGDFPKNEKYFPNLRPLPNELLEEMPAQHFHHPDCTELTASPKLQEHGAKVFAKLEEIVQALGNDDQLYKVLKEVGKLHQTMELPDRPFQDFKQSLSKFAELNNLENDEEFQRIWDAKIPLIMDTIIKYKNSKDHSKDNKEEE